jgi:hypothetical protein
MKKTLFLLVLSLLVFKTQAQIYPVSNNVVMSFPHPIFLFDYYEAGATNLQVSVKLNDFSVPTRNVKLKFTIENGDIELSTKNEYRPLTPIVLSPGVPLTLQGSDLFDALNTNNLNLKGITSAYLNANGGKLPEGQYNFCVEVLDYNSGKVLSLSTCSSVFLQLQQVPTLIAPICEEYIAPMNPQSIRFSWQTSGAGVPSLGGLTTYKLFLYKITEPNLPDPKNAVLNSKAVLVYESNDITLNNFNLDFSTTLLIAGNTYVYRIKATGPNGKETFENDGYTEWCWFNYGFPDDGIITLNEPFNEKQFSKTEQKVFTWGASDKGVNSQSYDYKLILVELTSNEQDLKEAVNNNSTFHEEKLAPTSSQDGASFLLNKALTPDKKYAWKIEAYSAGQKVAESEPNSFYSHSLIDYFYAANQKIKVIQITNPDLKDLSGKARIQLSKDETDFVDIPFSNIEIREISGDFILKSGEIQFDLSERTELTITPEIESNGESKFEYVSGTINSRGLKIDGKIKWKLPHSVLPGEDTHVYSTLSTFVMNSEGKLSGESAIDAFSTVLLSPKDFELSLNTSSMLKLYKSKLQVSLVGSVTLPESSNTLEGNRIKITIDEYQNQIDYIEISSLIGAVEGFAPINSFGMEVIPMSGGVIDFSEDQSPPKLSSDKEWKGFYVTDYKIRLHASKFDPTNQIKLPKKFDMDQTTQNTSYKFWVSNQGLTLNSDFHINVAKGIKFNDFSASLNGKFNIKKGQLKTTKLTGEIRIPFLSTEDVYAYEIPVTEEGLEEGFLIEDLTELEYVFNPNGGENRMIFDIKRAVFVDNKKLVMNVDIDMPELQHSETPIELDNFEIYGDNFIGVGGKNKAQKISSLVSGRYKGFDINITSFGASFLGNKYVLYIEQDVILPQEFSGPNDKTPSFVISSATQSGVVITEDVKVAPAFAVEIKDAAMDAIALVPHEIEVNLTTKVATAHGFLTYKSNNPTWGTKFEGSFDADLKVPGEISVGSNLILGKKGDLDYWYIDMHYQDKDGLGIDCKYFRTVGIEGRVFSHMKPERTKNDNGSDGFTLKLNENTVLGLAAYMQVIDIASNGFNYQADLAAEINITGSADDISDIEIKAGGKFSFLNANVRTSSGGTITKEVAKEVAEEVTNAAISEYLPQTITKDDYTITIDAENLKEGSIDIKKADFGTALITGDLNATPLAGLAFTKDEIKFNGNINLQGDATFKLIPKSAIEIAGTIKGMNQGKLKFKNSDFTVDFGGNIKAKTADMLFKKDDLTIGANVDATSKEGGLTLALKQYDFSSFANLKVPDESIVLGFKKADINMNLSYNNSQKIGILEGEKSGDELQLKYNINKKEGALLLKKSSSLIKAKGSEQRGWIYIQKESEALEAACEFEQKTGFIRMTKPNTELRGEIGENWADVFLKKDDLEIGAKGTFDGNSGELHLKEGAQELDIAANKTDEVGSLNYKNDEIAITTLLDPNNQSFVNYKKEDLEQEARIAENYYKVFSKNAETEYLLEQNLANETGRFVYKIPKTEVSGRFDAPAELAEIDILVDARKIHGFIEKDSISASYKTGGQMFDVSTIIEKRGTVEFSDDEKSLATKVSFDKELMAGSLFFKKSDFSTTLWANETTQQGSVTIQKSTDLIHAEITDSLFFRTVLDDNKFSAVKSELRKGISFQDKKNELDIYKYFDGEYFRLVDPNLKLTLLKRPMNYEVLFDNNKVLFNTIFNKQQIKLHVEKDDFKVYGNVLPIEKKIDLEYKNGVDKLLTNGSVNDQVFYTKFNIKDWKGLIDASLPKKNFELDITNNSDFDAKVKLDVTQAKLLFKKDTDFDIEGELSVNAQFFKAFIKDVALIDVDKTKMIVEINKISFKMPDFSTLNSDFKIDFSLDNIPFEFTMPTPCTFQLKEAGIVQDLGADYTKTIKGQELLVSASQADGGLIKLTTPANNISVSIENKCSDAVTFTINKDGVDYKFTITPSDISLAFNGYAFKTNLKDFIDLEQAGKLLSLTPTSIKATLPDFEINAELNAFGLSIPNFKMDVNVDGLTAEIGDQLISFNKDLSLGLQISPEIDFLIAPELLNATIGDRKIKLSSELIELQDVSKELVATISSVEAKLALGTKILSTNFENMKFEQENILTEISPKAIKINYEDYKLNVSELNAISVQEAEKLISVSAEALKLEYDGKLMEVLDGRVKLGMDDFGLVDVSKELLSFVNTDYDVQLKNPLTDPSFAYLDKVENALNLSKQEVSLAIDGNALLVNPTHLYVKYEEDFVDLKNMLDINTAALDFKYQKYEASFAAWTAIKLTNGIQLFEVDKSLFHAVIDESNFIKASLGTGNIPELNMAYDKEFYNVVLDHLSFDYQGQHFELNPKLFLRVHEAGVKTLNGVYVDITGAKYVYEDITLKLRPVGDLLQLSYDSTYFLSYTDMKDIRVDYDDYKVTLLEDMSVSLQKIDQHEVILNPIKESIGYKSLTEDIALYIQKFEEQSIGVVGKYKENDLYFFGEKNKFVGAGVKLKGKGKYQFAFDADKKIDILAKYDSKNFVDATFKDNKIEKLIIELENPSLHMNHDPNAIYKDVKSEIAMDGPQHLEDVSSAAGGWAYSNIVAKMTFKSGFALHADGNFSSGIGTKLPIFCTQDAPFSLDLKGKEFKFTVGSKSSLIPLDALCMGQSSINGDSEGYADITSNGTKTTAVMAVKFSKTISERATASFTVLNTSCSFGFAGSGDLSYELAGTTTINLENNIPVEFNQLIMKMDGNIQVKASSSCKIKDKTFHYSGNSSVSLSGVLVAEKDSKKASGELTGSLQVSSVSRSFTFNHTVYF